MARDTSSLQEAKMLLEVLKRIPLNRKISTTDLHQQLMAASDSASALEQAKAGARRQHQALRDPSHWNLIDADSRKVWTYRRTVRPYRFQTEPSSSAEVFCGSIRNLPP